MEIGSTFIPSPRSVLSRGEIEGLSTPLTGRTGFKNFTKEGSTHIGYDCKVIIPVETFRVIYEIAESYGISKSEKDKKIEQLLADAIEDEEVYYWSPSSNRYYVVSEIVSLNSGSLRLTIGQVVRDVRLSEICPNILIDKWDEYNLGRIRYN